MIIYFFTTIHVSPIVAINIFSPLDWSTFFDEYPHQISGLPLWNSIKYESNYMNGLGARSCGAELRPLSCQVLASFYPRPADSIPFVFIFWSSFDIAFLSYLNTSPPKSDRTCQIRDIYPIFGRGEPKSAGWCTDEWSTISSHLGIDWTEAQRVARFFWIVVGFPVWSLELGLSLTSPVCPRGCRLDLGRLGLN
jgi:hypothetical protein